MKQTNLRRAVNLTALVLAAGLLIGLVTGCPHKPKEEPKPQKITITVKSDEGVTVNEPKTLEVTKGTKWSEVKAKIKVSYKDGYEEKGWKLDGASGQDLEDGYVFNENKTVFALSKIKGITYKVEHLQQNIADNDYTLYETEILSGKAGETTSAAAKPYAGFTAQDFSQAAIKTDGSTVVQIKYNRNIIALKLDLNGGTTTTPLTGGEGGIKLLKGKFGAKVELENLKKGSDILDVWTPELPSTFPASSPDTTYAASWTDKYRITVKGDERTAILSDHIEIDLAPAKTWHDIQGDVANKVILKPEWPGYYYEVYEWRLDDENGTKLTDDYQIKSHITVYAVTNYAKFNIIDNKIKLTSYGRGYTGDKPKGKIIIPDGITEIEDGQTGNEGAFKHCTEITSVQFPQSLTKIGSSAFFGTCLTSISLPANLTEIGDDAFSFCAVLKSVNLPANLTQIGWGAFYECKGLTSAVFADKEGWAVYDDNSYSGTPTPINSSDLVDASKAAKYLREYTDKGGYCDKWWKKN
jgi:leucine-rich repeat protein